MTSVHADGQPQAVPTLEGRYSRLRPRMLRALTLAGEVGMTKLALASACGVTPGTIKTALPMIRRMAGVPMIATIKRPGRPTVYVLGEFAGNPARPICHPESAVEIMRGRVRAAGDDGIMSSDLRSGLSKYASNRASVLLSAAGELFLLRMTGGACLRRYFATAAQRDAAHERLKQPAMQARAEADRLRAAGLSAKYPRKSAKPRKKPQIKPHQHLQITQPPARPIGSTKWVGDVDYSRAKVTAGPTFLDTRLEVKQVEGYFSRLAPGKYPPGREWSEALTARPRDSQAQPQQPAATGGAGRSKRGRP